MVMEMVVLGLVDIYFQIWAILSFDGGLGSRSRRMPFVYVQRGEEAVLVCTE